MFSAPYDNYRVVMNFAQSDNTSGIGMRVRVAGSDLTSSTYKWSRYFNFSNDGAYLGGNSNSATSIDIPGGFNDRGLFVFDFG